MSNRKKQMPPLWMIYPNIPQGSIGWRMGYGEEYAASYWEWFYSLKPEEQKEHKELFPTPKCWMSSTLQEGSFWTYKWTKYGKPSIKIEDFEKQQDLSFVFFWGPHQSDHEIDKACLSQWFLCPFDVGHITYLCMEQYMMSKKAELFGDEDANQLIKKATEPKVMKALGRKVKNFQEETWDKFCYSIVATGNYYKFSQNPKLRNFLLHTKDSILVEASPYDTIWGIGMSEKDERKITPSLWNGKNLLGFALMEVREEIKRVWKNYNLINWSEIYDVYHRV